MKNVGTAHVRKPAGAQAALWAYASVALLALFHPAMTDDMLPIALVYSLVGLHVAGLFIVDLLGKLHHGVLRSWIAPQRSSRWSSHRPSPTACRRAAGPARGYALHATALIPRIS